MNDRILSIALALPLCTTLPIVAQQASPVTYPATLKITLDYSMTTEEDIGAVNVPQCRKGGWNADLQLNLVRKTAGPALVEYTVKDGTWKAHGDCSGHMEFEMGDQRCSWDRKDQFGGSGTLPAALSGAELIIHPAAKTFEFAFSVQAPGTHSYSWEPYCERTGGAGTTDWNFHGAFTGTVEAGKGGPKFTVQGDRSWTNDNIDGRYRSHAVATIYEKLKAVPGGPYAITRGQTVQLDGSRSEGTIDEYEWALKPNGDCPDGTKADLKLKGEKASFRALCPLTATLTVTYGSARDSRDASVEVKPRAWKTAVEHTAEAPLRDMPLPVMEQVLDEYGRPIKDQDGQPAWGIRLVGGENVAVENPDAPANQLLRPLAERGSWNGRGYTIERVTDDGPFGGLFFVSEYRLSAKRQTLVNQYLLPTGPPVAGKSLYAENKRQDMPIDAYLAAIRHHEGMRNPAGVLGHSGRFEAALRAEDPGPKLEALAAADSAQLRRKADEAIHAADVRMCTEGRDPLPEIWIGKLTFPKKDGSGWLIGQATVGGEAPDYKEMPACR